jgi:hypothetical protein
VITVPHEPITWKSLSEALAHVQVHEHSRPLAKRLLVKSFADKVRTRGYVTYRHGREGQEEPLSRELWTHYEGHSPAAVDWENDTARMSGGHVHPECFVYRIEVAQEDLFAIWPELPQKTKTSAAGRPRIYDYVVPAAEAYVEEWGCPRPRVTCARRLRSTSATERPTGQR